MSLNVLIVDDSAAIRKILHRVLVQADVPLGSVMEAGDGVEALAKLKQGPVGLILSDINMPNMDGIELLSNLKANPSYKTVPVLMVTTEGSQAKVMQALELGPERAACVFVASDKDDRIYRANKDDETFEDITAKTGLDSKSKQFCWVDLDGNGITDTVWVLPDPAAATAAAAAAQTAAGITSASTTNIVRWNGMVPTITSASEARSRWSWVDADGG